MSAPRFTITEQRQAVEDLIDQEVNGSCGPPDMLARAKQAVLTLGFIERNPDFSRALAIIMREFPEAKIVGVR